MNEEDLHQRLRYLNSCGNTRQQGIVSLRMCLIAEVTCSIAAMIVEESRELRAAARQLRAAAARQLRAAAARQLRAAAARQLRAAAARQLRAAAARLRWERLAPEAGDSARTLPAKG